MRISAVLWTSVCLLATVVASGCASGNPSPTQPSSAAGGATIAGVVSGAAMSPAALTVSVAGTSVSAAVDSAGHFSLAAVPASDVVLAFTGPSVQVSLPVGAVSPNDQIQLEVTITGATASLDGQHRNGVDQLVELDGTIAGIDPQGRQFTVNGTLIRVPTTATICRGDATVAFPDLANGDHLVARGVRNGDVVVAASLVVREEAQVPPPAPPPPPAAPAPAPTPAPAPVTVSFSGTVVGLTGACPTLTLKAGDVYIRTSGATTFTGKGCDGLKVGDAVSGVGTKQGDGVVLADRIEVAAVVPPPQTFSGAVVGFDGSCPALRMKISDAVYVRTDAATTFKGKGCSAVKAGSVIGGAGTKHSDGLILAVTLEVN